MTSKYKGINTKLVHAGEPRPLIEGAVSLPIFQSSTFEYGGSKQNGPPRYIRLNNTPNHTALHEKLRLIEGGEAALVTASGMAAISTALLAVLKPGDRLMVQSDLYGGTHSFVTEDLPELGIGVDFIDTNNPSDWTDRLSENTKAIYVESITNPLMKVCDLAAIVAFARDHNLVSMIDNTFTSPINYRPPEAGFDLSLHSCTKYLNGHSDVLAGAVIGRRDLIEKCARKLIHLGGALDPHACSMLHRGMKTLNIRMQRHNQNALEIALFLQQHPKITQVNFPGLPDSPYYSLAQHLFDGCGGMLSFEVEGGTAAADSLIAKLQLPICAPSLGGVESLITRPATTSHSSMSSQDRQKAGITDSLIRFSTGIEDAEDLIHDLEAGLSRI
ncbi:MAG: PLP-dependent aspartate aminotransferase family protein [Spirochaetaceae bacterium]|nr:PLP-dependent aspartate aminotransferase family protein [Spirochaetaceae bacterium]MCF7949455.1 PLP-dependent aspartate aminotransferase family protein [Spirochaetia bacterium]MCF7951348.1 PLP-dependent aspartate aminotransferase family protein [Spirochaetaceae bacterium]